MAISFQSYLSRESSTLAVIGCLAWYALTGLGGDKLEKIPGHEILARIIPAVAHSEQEKQEKTFDIVLVGKPLKFPASGKRSGSGDWRSASIVANHGPIFLD